VKALKGTGDGTLTPAALAPPPPPPVAPEAAATDVAGREVPLTEVAALDETLAVVSTVAEVPAFEISESAEVMLAGAALAALL